MAIDFTGTDFTAIDTVQTDRSADSIIAFSILNNLRYVGSQMRCASAVPQVPESDPTAHFFASYRWVTIYAQRLTLPRRTTRIYGESLHKLDDDTTEDVKDYGRMRMLVTPQTGDPLESSVVDPGVGPGSVNHVELSVEPDLQTPRPTQVVCELQFSSAFIKNTSSAITGVKLDQGMLGHDSGYVVFDDDAFRVDRSASGTLGGSGQDRPDTYADIMSSNQDTVSHIQLGSIPEGDTGTCYYGALGFIQPVAAWFRTESDAPTDIQEEALTHNRPLAAQSSIFQMAQEVRSRYERPRQLQTESEGPADDSFVDTLSGVTAADDITTLERTSVLLDHTSGTAKAPAEQPTSPSQPVQLEWRVALFPYYVTEGYRVDSEDLVERLLEDAGEMTYTLTITAEQLGAGDTWSSPKALGSTTVTYDEVPMPPTPISPKIPQLQSRLPEGSSRSEGHLYAPDLDARLTGYQNPRLTIDESNLDELRPVSIELEATINSYTKPETKNSRSDFLARLLSLFANPVLVPR